MNEEERRQHYETAYTLGAAFAGKVQAGLRRGLTFDQQCAMHPLQATRVRTRYQDKTDPRLQWITTWYDGYLSRWD